MRRSSPISAVCLAMLTSLAAAPTVFGQVPDQPSPVTPDDYGKWEQLGRAALSNNGFGTDNRMADLRDSGVHPIT